MLFTEWLSEMLATTSKSLTEVCCCRRGLFWRKFSLSVCTFLYFTELKLFREHLEATTYALDTFKKQLFKSWIQERNKTIAVIVSWKADARLLDRNININLILSFYFSYFSCHCFFLLPSCFFPLPAYSHHIHILGFKVTRIPKIIYRSSETDVLTGSKNEYYYRKAKVVAERRWFGNML